MIAEFFHGVVSTKLVLYFFLFLGGAGLFAGWLGTDPRAWLLGLVGKLSLAVSIFLAGYQSADNRAEHAREMAELRGVNQQLARDLGAEKIARAADKRIAQELAINITDAERDNDALREAVSRLAVADQCIATADDLRRVHGPAR
jgi:cobalamin biosynthesis protein CbiD